MAGISVEKRGSKWRYRFDVSTIDGKRTRVSKGGFDTEKKAMSAGVKAMATYNQTGSTWVPSEISYSDYLTEWIEKYCKQNLKEGTVANYMRRIRTHILPTLGKYKLKTLSPAILQSLIDDKFQEGYSRNTLSVLKGILSASLDYAVEPLRYIDKNPMVYVRMPARRAKPRTPTRCEPHVYITPEQMKEILTRFPEGSSAHIPLQLGYRCGLRIGEAYGILWDDLDLEAGKLSVKRQVQWDKTSQHWYFTEPKYDSFRTIDLDDEMVSLLKRELDRQERAQAYFADTYTQLFESKNHFINSSGDGTPIRMVMVRRDGTLISSRTIQHTSSVIHQQMHFPEFDFHSLRHTHASDLLAAGAPIKYVQTRLGHKRPDVTLRVYQHVTEVIENEGRDVLNHLFSK